MRLARLGLTAAAALALTTIVAPAFAEQAEEQEQRQVLMAGGEGHLGVGLTEVDAKAVERLKLKEERGALVRQVQEDSPGAKAGLKVDDVIVSYQNVPVESVMELTRRVRETPPGRTVSIEVVRQGALQKLSAQLDERRFAPFHMPMPQFDMPHFDLPDLDAPMPHPPVGMWHKGPMGPMGHGPQKLGLEFHELGGQLAEYFKVKQGLLVMSVVPDGPAAKAGIKAGDVLVRVGKQELTEGHDLRQALAETSAGDELTVTVERDGRPLELKVTVAGAKPEPDQAPAKTKPKKQART
jgi:serine protease Do